MEAIKQEIRDFMATSPTDAALTDHLNALTPNIQPEHFFNHLDTTTIKESTLVYARLMVQDIRDMYFYISFAAKRPFNEAKELYLWKYGHSPEGNLEEVQDNPHYIHVMTDRVPVMCSPVLYQSQWVDELEGRKEKPKDIVLEVDGKADFKLGQVITVVAFYEPQVNKLFMVRQVEEQKVVQLGIDGLMKLPAEVNLAAARDEMMQVLCGYCSETMAEYLLLTMLSDDPLFLGCEDNIVPLIQLVYPRVAHVKVVHPANQPIFPYKDEEGELKQTPMQLSKLPTYVMIDLSTFTNQDQVQLTAGELDNFKAFKLFVEEGKTVYKWEMGESQVDHKHRGAILKGSKLITPHFFPAKQTISPDFSNLKTLPIELLNRLRAYIQQASQLSPTLSEEQRKEIEKKLVEEQYKKEIVGKLAKIMQLAKLLAMSHGRTEMTVGDFERGRQLIDQNVE